MKPLISKAAKQHSSTAAQQRLKKYYCATALLHYCTFFLTSYFLLLAFAGCASLDIVKDRLTSPLIEGNKVTFYYDSPSARSVSVAGEFNGWEYRPEQSRALIMKKNEKGLWEVSSEIPAGRYQYKIVIDYQTWITDPYNTATIDDGRGNINSLLIVR